MKRFRTLARCMASPDFVVHDGRKVLVYTSLSHVVIGQNPTASLAFKQHLPLSSTLFVEKKRLFLCLDHAVRMIGGCSVMRDPISRSLEVFIGRSIYAAT